MVLGFDHDRRVRQVPVQRRDDGAHRYDPDRQNGDKTIAYAPSRPPHISTLGEDQEGVNAAIGLGGGHRPVPRPFLSLRCWPAPTAALGSCTTGGEEPRTCLRVSDGLLLCAYGPAIGLLATSEPK